MAFQAVPDAAEIVIEYTGNTVVQKNVLHAVKAGGYNLADLTALAVAVDGEVSGNWLADQPSDLTYVQTTVRGLAFENDQEVLVNTGSGPGLGTSQSLPGNVTFAIKKLSAQTGRSARGRLYWIGLAKDSLAANENQLLSGTAAAIVANVESMRAVISATVWNAVIVSRFNAGVERAFGVTFDWINTAAIDENIDSQRRRLL